MLLFLPGAPRFLADPRCPLGAGGRRGRPEAQPGRRLCDECGLLSSSKSSVSHPGVCRVCVFLSSSVPTPDLSGERAESGDGPGRQAWVTGPALARPPASSSSTLVPCRRALPGASSGSSSPVSSLATSPPLPVSGLSTPLPWGGPLEVNPRVPASCRRAHLTPVGPY